jgi:CRP-like cAMP-binding protein
MSLETDVKFLRKIPIFSHLDPSKLKLIAFTSERLSYAPDEIVVNEGEEGESVFIILEGDSVAYTMCQGKRLKLADIKQGEILGEISVLCDIHRTATVVAKTDLTILSLSRELFFRLIREVPDLSIEIMKSLARRLVNTTNQLKKN